jgi:N-acetylglucosaminyldiphosphoundecaprenol N-acetyl-beta-D-mannosaminyltransferase
LPSEGWGVAGGAAADPLEDAPDRKLLGLRFADLPMDAVLARLAARDPGADFAYVTTPNADHLVRLARQPEFGELYEGAALRLLDSRVVARLARALGMEPPPVVPGSDLTAALFGTAIRPGEPVTVLGAPADAIAAIRARYGLRALAHHDPPMGFDADPEAMERALSFLEANPARFTFLAVGSPRQCRVALALARRGRARGIGLCIGASLLFLSGHERRAPRAVQLAGMEWAWRLAQDPRRLARRYLRDNPAILALLWREAQGGRG